MNSTFCSEQDRLQLAGLNLDKRAALKKPEFQKAFERLPAEGLWMVAEWATRFNVSYRQAVKRFWTAFPDQAGSG